MLNETEVRLERARQAISKGKNPMESMAYQARYIFTGIFVFLAGILLLLNSLGIIPWKFWSQVWVFWPALVLLFGVRMIFGRNRTADFLIFLTGLIFFAIMVAYGLIRVNSPLVNDLPVNLTNFVRGFSAKQIR
jgi:predicted neutral ceramidase superfamily lipid hydrolase